MNASQVNQAIAELCGWKIEDGAPHFRPSQITSPTGEVFFADYGASTVIPNFHGDLNAIALAEATLTDEERWEQIKLIVDYEQEPGCFPLLSRSEALALHQAKAEKHAETFLRVKGRWEDGV